MFEAFSNGLVAIFNGLLAFVGMAVSLRTLLVVAMIGCFVWLAFLEVDELDRQGVKPGIAPH